MPLLFNMAYANIRILKDNYALFEGCPPPFNQRSIFRTFCHYFILVSDFVSAKMSIFINSLHRIIGVQTFKGSMQRTCVISPTLGEGNISTSEGPPPFPQFCGGHIDPVHFNVTGYIMSSDNKSALEHKGFICPLGQVCMVS